VLLCFDQVKVQVGSADERRFRVGFYYAYIISRLATASWMVQRGVSGEQLENAFE
jgi:hypothetical protein